MVSESVHDSKRTQNESKNACEPRSDKAANYQKHGSSQALVDVREPELHMNARKRSFGDIDTVTSSISCESVASSASEKSSSTHTRPNHVVDGALGDDGTRKRSRTSEDLPSNIKDPSSETGQSPNKDLSVSNRIVEFTALPSVITFLRSNSPKTSQKDPIRKPTSYFPPKPLIDDQFYRESQRQLSHYSSIYLLSPDKEASMSSNSPGPPHNYHPPNGRRSMSPVEHQSNFPQHQAAQDAQPRSFYSKSGQPSHSPTHPSHNHSTTEVPAMSTLSPSSLPTIPNTKSQDNARPSTAIQEGTDATMKLFAEQLNSMQSFYKQQMAKFTAIYEANQRATLESELAKKETEVQHRLNKGFLDALAAKEKEAQESLNRVRKKAYEACQKQLEISEANFQKVYQEKLDSLGRDYSEDLQGKQERFEKAEQDSQTTIRNLSQSLQVSEVKFAEAVKLHETEVSRLKNEGERVLKIKETELADSRTKEAFNLSELREVERRLKFTNEKLREIGEKYADQVREMEGTEQMQKERDTALEVLRRDFGDRLEACIAEDRRKSTLNAELQEKVRKLEEQAAAKQEQDSLAETKAKKAGLVIMTYLEDARVKEDLVSERSSLLSAKKELLSLQETLTKERKLIEEEKHALLTEASKLEQEKELFEEVKNKVTSWVDVVKPSLEAQHKEEKEAWEKDRASWEQTLKNTISRERKAAELVGYEKAINEAHVRTQKLTDSENKVAAEKIAVGKEKLALSKLSQNLDKRKKELESTHAAKLSEVEKVCAETLQRMQEDDKLRIIQLNEHWAKEMEGRWATLLESDKKQKEKEQTEHEAERVEQDRDLQLYKQRLEEAEQRLRGLEKQHVEDVAHAQTQAKAIEDLMDGRKLAALGTYSRAEAKDVLEKLVLPTTTSHNDVDKLLDCEPSSKDPCHLQ